MKLLTLDDYQRAGETFWPKYWYVAKELGEDAKPEDVIKVMEAIGGVALKAALEEKSADPFGFNKKVNEDGAPILTSSEDSLPGTVAIYSNDQWAAYNL